METETSAGQASRTARNEYRSEKNAGSSHTIYRVRCPDCGHSKECQSRTDAVTHQRRHPCPNCDRMMGISQKERHRETAVHLRASEAVAAALDVQRDFVGDESLSVNAILEAMGRDPDGYPAERGPTGLTADQAVRCLLEDVAV